MEVECMVCGQLYQDDPFECFCGSHRFKALEEPEADQIEKAREELVKAS